jgi:hypothetical protein
MFVVNDEPPSLHRLPRSVASTPRHSELIGVLSRRVVSDAG